MLDFYKIGHYTDEENGTGVTVILPSSSAVCSVEVRGYSPATRETDLLSVDKTVQKVNAVVLSGGSAFGLESDCGVVDYLRENDIGYDTGKFRVPIVVGASIYDLEYKNFAYPDKNAGYIATKNAKANNFESGVIGGATGATISKALGIDYAVKTRLGIATLKLNDIEIAVITVVNALGDVVKNGKIIAGAKLENGEYADVKRLFTLGTCPTKKSNTTIGCIITNADLTKRECHILCSLAHDGYAKAFSPSHTLFDGDAMFCMASGEKKIEFNMLTAIIPDLTEQAIHNSVMDTTNGEKKVNGLVFKAIQKIFK